MEMEMESIYTKTDVTCVKFIENCIFAGIGSNIHIFSKDGMCLQIFKVFDGKKVHGIRQNATNKIAVFGGNLLKIVEFDFIKSRITKELNYRYCEDWIFDIQWLDNDSNIITIFAHNYVTLYSASELNVLRSIGCQQACLLYSALFVNNIWDNLFVLSGTVFGEILIWRPSSGSINTAEVIYRLKGHNGAIFSISYSEALNLIVSTSDDRSVRLWTAETPIFNESLYHDQNCQQINLKYNLYGHVARVFKCKILGKHVVSAGEDSFIHIWNLDGTLLRKFETHQGGAIRALDTCDEDELIVTGGGDAGISLYPLKINTGTNMLEINEKEMPKALGLTASNNVVLVMYSGLLKYYDRQAKSWSNVDLIEDAKGYAVLEVSQNREFIALAGLRGSINIYKELNNSITKVSEFKYPSEQRIYALHWLTDSTFLTSHPEGIMELWLIDKLETKYELTQLNFQFTIPPCKERWATCATLCFTDTADIKQMLCTSFILAVGDRKGNIHFYNRSMECIQTIRKAHCHLGVTHLYFDKYLYSLGRNSILNKYDFNPKTNNVIKIEIDKLPISWLYTIQKHKNTRLLFGFSGAFFILYNLSLRRIILEINCGGGHRSWDCMITKSNILDFYFIKEMKINYYTEKFSNILTTDLINGYHNKEINTGMAIYRPQFGENLVFISGGEDTTIRVTKVNVSSVPIAFETVLSIKLHLSSVRCITSCEINDNKQKNVHQYLIFSGGGRAQIILQKLSINETSFEVKCEHIHSYYKSLNEEEAETRIMDLVAIHIASSIIVVAACSDGSLQCFMVSLNSENTNKMELTLLGEVKYILRCIMRLATVKIFNRHIIISMATDGLMVFWDFTDLCTLGIPCDKKIPFFSFKTHQNSTTSVSCHQIDNSTFIFATGGDDDAFDLRVVQFSVTDDCAIAAKVVCFWRSSRLHAAQVSGIYIDSDYVITTSIDQYINIIKYDFDGQKLKCEVLNQHCSSISDIHGLQCVVINDKIFVLVYGKGIELCQFKSSITPSIKIS